jgi:hypothetical protein
MMGVAGLGDLQLVPGMPAVSPQRSQVRVRGSGIVQHKAHAINLIAASGVHLPRYDYFHCNIDKRPMQAVS